MTAPAGVQAARHSLGRVGALLPESPHDPTPADLQRQACRRLESLGFRWAWTNELIGKDCFAQLGVLLAAIERMVFGTWIATVLSEAYPGRVVLGLGVGYPQQAESVGTDFGRPVRTIQDHLTGVDGVAPDTPAPCARIVGANRPRMLELAARSTDGALPAGSTPTETAATRTVLGPDKLLVVYLDASAGQGSTEQVSATSEAHLDAGADTSSRAPHWAPRCGPPRRSRSQTGSRPTRSVVKSLNTPWLRWTDVQRQLLMRQQGAAPQGAAG